MLVMKSNNLKQSAANSDHISENIILQSSKAESKNYKWK